MRYHFPPVRMAIIKKTKDNKCCRGCREIGSFIHCLWECKMVQQLWKMVWSFLKKLKIALPYDPAIPLLSIYPQELKSGPQRDYLHLHIHSTIIHNSQDTQTTQMSINRQMNKENAVYTYNGILFCLQKEENLPFVRTCMELEDIMLSETSQSQKDK